jgi:uncharacterized protein Usg
MLIIPKIKPVVLQIIYYLPDHPMLLQEFTWGFEDKIPELVRAHKFLNHWKSNIDAIIAEILISINDGPKTNWRSVDEILNIH